MNVIFQQGDLEPLGYAKEIVVEWAGTTRKTRFHSGDETDETRIE
jgi:hypothetical protein